MHEAVIVDVVRTPNGKRNGALRDWHPVDLLAHVLDSLRLRNDLDPAIVDDVITGCVVQVGEQALNIGRNAVLAAGWPESVPATTVDRQCGSSQQAVHFAAQGVMAGAYDVVIAAGVEAMSRVPMLASVENGLGQDPNSPLLQKRYQPVESIRAQGLSAELVAERWDLSRADLDRYSVRSHHRAARARAEGHFDREIVAVPVDGGSFAADEGIREGSSEEVLATLKPAFLEHGRVTAASSSQISDGASAVLIMSDVRANQLGLRPRARFQSFAIAGADPVAMLTAPIPATEQALGRAGLSTDDIDLYEINEAFAPVVLAWQRDLGIDPDKVNVNGGAIALGHPLGSSGTRLLATLLNELERSGGRYGLQTMCEAGGMANATVIERLG